MCKTTEVRCCDRHEENVQLVWTFAFNDSEYWCPYCGANYGMMGAGEYRELSFSQKREMIKYRSIGKDYLDARSSLVCSSLLWEGERISPHDLPNKEKQRIQDVIDNWAYPIETKVNA